MQKELYIENQVISFTLLPTGNVWRAILTVNEGEYEVETERLEEDMAERVSWEKVENVLRLILASYPALIEKAYKNLEYFLRESGLYSNTVLEPINDLDLVFIEVLSPLASQIAFRLYFLPDNIYTLDPYGLWRVTFLQEHVVGVERIQQ